MDLSALQRAGAATRPALEPFADDLRCRFDPAYARARDVAYDIASGRRNADGRTADAIRRAENRGNSRGAFQCWECHRIGTVHSAVDTCRHPTCGYSHGGINHRAVSVT
jgi:hypothetical protein